MIVAWRGGRDRDWDADGLDGRGGGIGVSERRDCVVCTDEAYRSSPGEARLPGSKRRGEFRAAFRITSAVVIDASASIFRSAVNLPLALPAGRAAGR